ncbi:hypothetical protein [Propionimicrobium sp. PCR01-08-3]|uniref:hypothetical protein n=1 Tax=Propionimicrobium sp. PCR01-08-3 TaxID=3052086 RepID=UPI00255CB0F8|nr:hypothetical protein [Propionimicrobium sp. PCR01-08-3]WIY82318.1 hypothetical protein QQ658_12545 [Propionimicrobium sp. PCR01-08-3]
MSAETVGPVVPGTPDHPGIAGEAALNAQAPSSDGMGMLVSYSPIAIAQRAGGIRKNLDRTTIMGVISLIITVALYLYFKPETTSVFFWLLIASAAYTVANIIVKFVQLKRARKSTAQVPLGPAFQIDDHGLVLSTRPEGERIDWEQVTSIKGTNKIVNPGPRLEIHWDENRSWSVPIIVLDASPSAVDSALRAFSLGRFGLDLSSVDDIW